MRQDLAHLYSFLFRKEWLHDRRMASSICGKYASDRSNLWGGIEVEGTRGGREASTPRHAAESVIRTPYRSGRKLQFFLHLLF